MNPDTSMIPRAAAVCYDGAWFGVQERVNRKGLPRYHCFRTVFNMGFPLIADTVYHTAPVLVVSDELNRLTEDEWVARAGDRLPLNYENISTSVTSSDSTVHCALYCFETYSESASAQIAPRSSQPPLIALAEVYKKYGPSAFIIWQIGKEYSHIAICEGETTQTIDFYAGWDEIRAKSNDCESTLAVILNHDQQKYPVYLVPTSPEQDFTTLALPLKLHPLALPEIPGIDPLYHEAYALLTCGNVAIPDLSDASQIEVVESASQGFVLCRNARFFLQKIAVVALFFLLLWAGGLGVSEYVGRSKREPLQPILTEIDKLSSAQKSLLEEYGTLAASLGKESQITALMNELSTLFPTGAWADLVEISDQGDPAGWKVDLVLSASGEQLVPTIVGSLEKNRTISSVRLIYSERKRIEGALLTQAKLEFFFNPQQGSGHVSSN